MIVRKTHRFGNSRGQSLVETALMLPLLLLVVFNVVNLGYFFLVLLNLTGASRTSTEYAIMGASTPAQTTLPSPGPGSANCTPTTNLTVAYVVQQDMCGALWNPTGSTVTSVQVCTSGIGVNGSGATQKSNCQTCSGNSCQSVVTTPPATLGPDPEAPNFVLNQVEITYTFNTLIPGKIFNIPLQASSMCSSGTCTFIRRANMRAMN